MRAFADTGLAYADMLASVDALVTKPGYGSFVEAVGSGVPVLYLPRPDWPEAPYLIDWLRAHGNALEIGEAELRAGRIGAALHTLWRQAPARPRVCDGAEVAARRILAGR
jgi:UDP:flavonoid glycosyltransferase YjiC (YdhE family)